MNKNGPIALAVAASEDLKMTQNDPSAIALLASEKLKITKNVQTAIAVVARTSILDRASCCFLAFHMLHQIS